MTHIMYYIVDRHTDARVYISFSALLKRACVPLVCMLPAIELIHCNLFNQSYLVVI